MDEQREKVGPVLDCPVCRTPMQAERHASLMLDRCGACDGLWFDRAELDAYLQTSPSTDVHLADPRPVREGEPLPCPRCATPTLDSYRVAAVVVSRCSACEGVYLDGDDVRALSGARPRYQPAPGPPTRAQAAGETVVGLTGEFMLEAVLTAGTRAALGALKAL